MQSFWDTLPKPFFAMAPMADVTDPAWRALVAKLGKPNVTFTEFVSADGLYHTREIQKWPNSENPLMRDLLFSNAERPIVAQFFTASPSMMAYAAKLAEELGFDGVDINMGCPDSTIERQGAGACLIKTPELAHELIRVAQAASPLPVSVKTRVGYNTEVLDEWLPALLEARPAAVTLHLRTRKEMSLVSARWDLMPHIIALRDQHSPKTFIVSNGDIRNLDEARARAADTGCDGVMIGRGMFGNPWAFAGRKAHETLLKEKLAALIELAHAFEKLSPPKSFHILKKHIKAFVTGFDGASELRGELMNTQNVSELEAVIRQAA